MDEYKQQNEAIVQYEKAGQFAPIRNVKRNNVYLNYIKCKDFIEFVEKKWHFICFDYLSGEF